MQIPLEGALICSLSGSQIGPAMEHFSRSVEIIHIFRVLALPSYYLFCMLT